MENKKSIRWPLLGLNSVEELFENSDDEVKNTESFDELNSTTEENKKTIRWPLLGLNSVEELFENSEDEVKNTESDDELNSTMEELQNDVNSILNGTKHKLIVNEILNEPLLKKKKFEKSTKVIEPKLNPTSTSTASTSTASTSTVSTSTASTSTAYINWLNDGFDGKLFDCVTLEMMTTPEKATKAEIDHKRNLARTKRADSRNDKIKKDISELFWPIESWPAFAVEILYSTDFNYNERITFATFFHGNGLTCPSLPISILYFYNPNAYSRKWKQKLYKFEKLFHYLDKTNDRTDPLHNELIRKYYYYSMINKHMMYYNGEKRKNGKPDNFVWNDKYLN